MTRLYAHGSKRSALTTPDSQRNEHEEGIVSAFIVKEKQDRYRFLLGNDDLRRRDEVHNRLNHCRDLDPKYVSWLPGNADAVALLKQAGSPKQVYLLSCNTGLDGATMPLKDAVDAVSMPENGWGTIVSCIPGELAYYYDEEGTRRAILRRPGPLQRDLT